MRQLVFLGEQTTYKQDRLQAGKDRLHVDIAIWKQISAGSQGSKEIAGEKKRGERRVFGLTTEAEWA
ncbi:hypothetical protein [Undibacterium terreum]|uniref:Uncharacterized protein n=1 Tax=Undibacterium terreum TaxID=1224302 RepID=A0A916XMF0_9BURK|nr:hypothetical protein [Undibacterium terreum]GGC86551.1 hypothetical protein GCM10011396_37310 [Undibacterium terreum]